MNYRLDKKRLSQYSNDRKRGIPYLQQKDHFFRHRNCVRESKTLADSCLISPSAEMTVLMINIHRDSGSRSFLRIYCRLGAARRWRAGLKIKLLSWWFCDRWENTTALTVLICWHNALQCKVFIARGVSLKDSVVVRDGCDGFAHHGVGVMSHEAVAVSSAVASPSGSASSLAGDTGTALMQRGE